MVTMTSFQKVLTIAHSDIRSALRGPAPDKIAVGSPAKGDFDKGHLKFCSLVGEHKYTSTFRKSLSAPFRSQQLLKRANDFSDGASPLPSARHPGSCRSPDAAELA